MRAHMRSHHIEKVSHTESVSKEDKPMTVDEFYEENFGETPRWAIALSGLRYREGISQSSLGEIVGVAQTNISKMEKGKRPIGKVLAKKLAKFFKTDYRLFL